MADQEQRQGGITAMMLAAGPKGRHALAGDRGESMISTMGFGFDAVIEKCRQGIRARRVGDAPVSFLPYLAADRGNIVKGLFESDESFRARIASALDDLHIAGNPWSVLRQVLGYVLDYTPRALTVQTSYTSAGAADASVWDSYATGASTARPPVYLGDTNGGWNWDQHSPGVGSWGWWRWYLVMSNVDPNPWVNFGPLWGSGVAWGGGFAWGGGEDNLKALSLRRIVKQWQPVGPTCHWIIVTGNDAEFVPGSPEGGGVNPDGYFGHWSKLSGGVYVRARFSDARYFKGPRTP